MTKVQLLAMTSNPIEVMYTAARTCYAVKMPTEIWKGIKRYAAGHDYTTDCEELEKMWKLVKQVLDSGHLSIAEHVSFTFAIEGISRACSHQLVRHRHCTFSQQSQRYVKIEEDSEKLHNSLLIVKYPDYGSFSESDIKHCKDYLKQMAEKYFVGVNDDNYLGFCTALVEYLDGINRGQKPEDARQFLPNATKTNLIMTLNYRQLMHICNLRLCTRAQQEIRTMFKEIVKEVELQNEELSAYLVPQCEIHGFCTEHKCCGRKPHISTFKPV